MKVAGVVVLYNPNNEEVITNINSYLPELDKLIIVDNTGVYNTPISDYYSSNEKVKYLSLEGNKGIAHALNIGIHFGEEQDQDWLLTMDQDSNFYPEDFSKFIGIVKKEKDNFPDAAIFSPRHSVPYIKNDTGIVKVVSAMTSGNLIRMDLISDIGYFDANLFIDSVDHEYCYRINKLGYGVYRVNDIELAHNLGELETKTLLGRKLHVTNHNYVRRYYITRNALYVGKKYAPNRLSFIKSSLRRLFWTSIAILLYEKNKRLKFRSTVLGLIDFSRSNMGERKF